MMIRPAPPAENPDFFDIEAAHVDPATGLRHRRGHGPAQWNVSRAGALDGGNSRSLQTARLAHPATPTAHTAAPAAAPTRPRQVEFIGINRQAQAQLLPFAQRHKNLAIAFESMTAVLISFALLPLYFKKLKTMQIPQLAVLLAKLVWPEKIHSLRQKDLFKAAFGSFFNQLLDNKHRRVAYKLIGFNAVRAAALLHCMLQANGRVPHNPMIQNVEAMIFVVSRMIVCIQATSEAVEGGAVFSSALAVKLGMRPTESIQETLRVAADLRAAKPLLEQVQQWREDFTPAQQQQIDEGVWQGYSGHISGPVFSSFLSKLFDGFPVSYSRNNQLQGRQEIAKSRLFPVLLAVQNSEEFAHRVFAIADAGLGACTDRPPLTFVDIELETRLHTAVQALSNPRWDGPPTKILRSEILCCELQKFYKHHATNLLRNHIRTAGVAEDIEGMMVGYELIQKKANHLFPALPYRKYASTVDRVLLTRLSDKVRQQLASMEYTEAPQPLLEHLLASDSWRHVLQVLTGKDTAQLQDQVIADINTQLEFLTDQALEGQMTEAQYTTAMLELQQQRECSIANIYNTAECRMWTQNQLEGFLGLNV